MKQTVATADWLRVLQFGSRLQRIFKRCEDSAACNCGRSMGHLSTCPKHAWETAITMVQMEMEDETGQ